MVKVQKIYDLWQRICGGDSWTEHDYVPVKGLSYIVFFVLEGGFDFEINRSMLLPDAYSTTFMFNISFPLKQSRRCMLPKVLFRADQRLRLRATIK